MLEHHAEHEHHSTIFLIGSWINIFLYSTEITLGVYFFLHHKQNRFQKFSLGGSLLLDTVCTMFVCYFAWLHTAPKSLIDDTNSREGVVIILTYLVSVLEQLYLVHRYWILARNRIVVSFVLLGAIIHLVFGFITGIYALLLPDLVNRYGVPSIAVAAVTCAATDLLIAINMFRAARSVDTVDAPTQSLLYRLSLVAITSGVVTAIAATFKVILLFTSIQAFVFVFNLVGRLYTLTIVGNCIALKRHKNPGVVDDSSQAATSSETQTRRDSRFGLPGSVVLTPLDLHTFTIPEDIQSDSDVPSAIITRS
ncbi:hypothetical protein E1B28_005632 [Marasmius oreades]|uniref:Uncharacterized protein n=1 Tax=Marasmius oreades TaxID=181124 RepID=A0A9P7UW80_9AGAR|nr:uncharacterized protein E1B28_005632 [Marasmius oreades]KAG7094819.1 hypothetical protein E1B28_005632 [Marasmius oreades]